MIYHRIYSASVLTLGTIALIAVPAAGGDDPIAELQTYLQSPLADRQPVAEQTFADVPLTTQQVSQATQLLWDDHAKHVQATRAAEMQVRVLKRDDLEMPFFYKTFGDKPTEGRSLYISMHGGGGAPPVVNDQQWDNQKQLYQLPEGVYLAPRAPTDNWNLWHESHIDWFFDRLIENLIVLEEVNSNRVYLMGYSAGGDGAFQLGARMADRWAAVAMMAGHPNDTSPLSLRNTSFAIYMGGRDAAYKRNEIAKQWQDKLAQLQASDPAGYRHQVTIYPNKGHWMDGEDASSIDWMRKQTRNPLPKKIVWHQDDVTHNRFYWLADKQPTAERKTTAEINGSEIRLQSEKPKLLTIRLNDSLINLDQPVRVSCDGKVLFDGKVARSIGVIHKTLAERGDPRGVFSGEIVLAE